VQERERERSDKCEKEREGQQEERGAKVSLTPLSLSLFNPLSLNENFL